ncbi:ABC transporter substrate-binding protein [Veillonella criceti]|uniref:Staphylococcal iron-regulated protein F n=1 Tax=Veillonella criceti TaxID=103891 RepID=A0A380NDQ6_9FIRM|nr:ABC transporter substrate-binding protein [Veillonella criceti]SUP37170.1 Staphylococcal iron-regulated protein F [Veillonella criceti]
MKRYIFVPVVLAIVCVVGLAVWLTVGTSSASREATRQVVDAMGTNVTIPVHPKRVVILNTANLDMYYAAGGQAVGKPKSSYYSKELLALTKEVPSVGTIHSPNVEAIIGLNPDLVIGLNVPFNTNLRGMLAQADIPLYINNLNTYEDVVGELRFFGELTGQSAVADATAKATKANYNTLVEGAKTKVGPRTLIIFGAPGSFSMATSNSFSGNILKLLGGHNIADLDTRVEGDFVPLSMEYVIKTDPEVIFFISMTPKSDSVDAFKREMLLSTAWAEVSAVKSQRIYYLSGGLFAANPGTRISEALTIMYDDLYGKEATYVEP